MARILVVYGTTEGHTAKVAERMAGSLREIGHQVDVHDARELMGNPGAEGYHGTLVGGSVHVGEHQSSVREFVVRNRELLESVPSAFFSVSLAAAEPDDPARVEARTAVDKFVRETGWEPKRVEMIAGALVYSQYNLFVRHLMKLISKRHGGPTDTTHDYEYTDWEAVDAFARDFAERLGEGPRTG